MEFGSNIKHPESLVNFIAAYGIHPLLADATTVAEKRAAAVTLVYGAEDDPQTDADESFGPDTDFLNGTGAFAGVETGLNDVDLWIGGLAEKSAFLGRAAGLDLQLRFRDSDGAVAERRPLLLPIAVGGHELPEPTRGHFVFRDGDAQYRCHPPSVRCFLGAGPHDRSRGRLDLPCRRLRPSTGHYPRQWYAPLSRRRSHPDRWHQPRGQDPRRRRRRHDLGRRQQRCPRRRPRQRCRDRRRRQRPPGGWRGRRLREW